MLSSLLVSWRNVTRHKKRFLFTLIATVLGVAVMTSMFIAKGTFANLMEEQEALYAGEADFWVQSSDRFFSEQEWNEVLEQEQIDASVSSLFVHGFVEQESGSLAENSVRFTGVSNFQNELIALPVKDGDVTKEGLIITENAAKLWKKKVGDKVTFQDMGEMEITAIVYEGAMLNSPKTMEEAFYKDFRVMVPLETLQKWAGKEGQISNYRFRVKEDTNKNELLTTYQTDLAGTSLFVQPIVMDSKQNNDVDDMYFVFDLIAILSIFISGFIAFNMIHTSILERKKEIAIMKSLGYTSGSVIRLILRETGFLAVIGTFFGIGIGIWLGVFVQDILIAAISSQEVSYDLVLGEPIIISIIIGLLFPFLAAALPLYKAGRTPILEGMFNKNGTQTGFKRLHRARIIIGLVCTGIGLIDNVWAFLFLFIGLVLLFPLWMRIAGFCLHPIVGLLFRFSGKQAIQSIKQFENRIANTTAMLAIGVCLALFMSAALEALPKGMEKEIRATYGGDILVEKETPWTDSELGSLMEMEGVQTAFAYKEIPNVTWLTKDNELREFSLMSYSEQSSLPFMVTDETDQESDYPAIYVGERALTEWGGEVGDVFSLNTPAGEQAFFVKGIAQTTRYSNYVGIVEESVMSDELNWPGRYHVMLDVEDESHISTVLSEIWNQFGADIANTDTVTNNIEQTTRAISGMEELMQGLLLLIIAISAVGVSNTLFMNTMERIRELGTMRAIGFTKGQVRRMIVAEGLFIGIVGVIFGTLYGILVIYLNSISKDAQGLVSFMIPWNSFALAVAGGIIFTLLASWLPSRAASRIPVKEAINYE